MSKGENATYLFEGECRNVRHSESFWTSLFVLLVLYISKSKLNFKIPLYRFVVNHNNNPWGFQEDGELQTDGLAFKDIFVEPKLANLLPNEAAVQGYRPDIAIFYRNDKRLVIIEDKTIGAKLGNEIDNYKTLADKLGKKLEYETEVLLLISVGEENNGDWKKIENTQGIKLILWESILQILNNPALPFQRLFDEDLKPYAEILETAVLK